MKSFATSICPIKNPLAVNMRHWVAAPSNPRAIPAPSQCHPRAIPASSQRGETITQPISKRFLSGVITALRHGDPAQRCLRGSPAWQSRHLSSLRHGHLTHRYSRAIPAWRRGSSDRSLARRPRLQVPQGHPRVAKMVFYLRSSMK